MALSLRAPYESGWQPPAEAKDDLDCSAVLQAPVSDTGAIFFKLDVTADAI
jgi:hypothetical protein